MDFLSDIALRLVAAFYAIVQIAGIRRLTMDRLLDNAIAAISGKADRSLQARADRLRWQSMLLLLVAGAPGSILTMLMMSAGIPFLIATSALALANMTVVLPKFVDPHDPPDGVARRRSWIATFAYVLFTIWAILHWRSGGMTALDDTQPLVIALAGALLVLFALHSVYTLRKAQLGGARSSASDDLDEPLSDEYLAALQAENETYRGVNFVLRPALGESVLFRADTGAVVPYHLPIEELDHEFREALRQWQTPVRKALDPDDPRRASFASSASREAVLSEGRALFERLRATLGEQRIRFDPEPLPHEPSLRPQHIIVRACVREWPVADAQTPDCPFFPGNLGISLRLEDDLLDWSHAFDESSIQAANNENLFDKPLWTPERWAEFAARGKALAERLREELAATGHSDVRVTYRDPEIGPDAPRQ